MSHHSVRTLLKDTVRSVSNDLEFHYGRPSDINMAPNKSLTRVETYLLEGRPAYQVNSSSNYAKTWNITMLFYKKDSTDSTEEEYCNILDDVDEIVDKFINKLNRAEESGADDQLLSTDSITLSGFQQIPVIKDTTDIVTGWSLSFQMIVPDTFDYCSIYD